MLTCARVGPGTLGVRAEEPRSSRPASLGLPPGQLTAQCGTVRSARAASRRRAPRWVPRVRPVAMAGLVVSGTQVSPPRASPASFGTVGAGRSAAATASPG